MRIHTRVALLATLILVILGLSATGAAAKKTTGATAPPPPFWMTPEIRDRIAASEDGATTAEIQSWVRQGLAGEQNREQPVPDPCPGVEPYPTRQVNANGCIVYPYGCTANFIFMKGELPFTEFSDGRHHFIGTAGHCVDHANQPVFMQTFTGVVEKIGEVEKILAAGDANGQGALGNDYTIIQIDPGLKVEPRIPTGGPQDIYVGCEPRAIEYWGHGHGFFVGQGRLEAGVVPYWFERGFHWAGFALPGDSGSGVVIADNKQAAGDLTHLAVDLRRYPGAILAGTRVTRALTWMGGEYYLVNQDRTKARATMAETQCEPLNSSP